jgi:CBS domain-containing protein
VINKPLPIDPGILAETVTFHNLERELLAAIIECSQLITLKSGEFLFVAGDDYRNQVHILYQGEVDLERSDGSRIPISAGSFIGLANYLDGSPYSTTAHIVRDAKLLQLEHADLEQLERNHPELEKVLNRFIAKRLRRWSPTPAASSGILTQPVSTAMKAPLSVCDGETSLREAFDMMQSRKIGSLGVVDEAGVLLGVLTFAGLAESVLHNMASPDESVLGAACETPRTISPDAPLWEAEEKLHHHNLKYLIVTDHNKPLGMLSQTDIMRALHHSQNATQDRIAATGSLDELARFKISIGEIAQTSRENNRLPSRAVRQLSDVHNAIQHRCIELTLEQMTQKGFGSPPLNYALLVMGSGGRDEMLLNPDQDNGIILADEADEADEDKLEWFRRFSDLLNINLDRVGYELCKGDIMARNPMFHKTLSQWKQQISHMVHHPNQKAARWSNIVFDFATLYGDDSLTIELRRHIFRELKAYPKLLEFMVEDDAEGRPPLGFFNQLITDGDKQHKGMIDIKRNGLRIVGDAARIFSLKYGISACNTNDRLKTLQRLGIFSSDFIGNVTDAYELLLDMLLMHQIEQQAAGLAVDKLIDVEHMSSRNREMLRAAMRAIKRLQSRLQDEFTPSPF